MNRKSICLLLVGYFSAVSGSFGQFEYDFFWSDKILNDGAANSDLAIDVNVGAVVPLYLYWTTNGPANSEVNAAAVDVTTSSPGVIRFESAATVDFHIVIAGNPIANRWLRDADGGFAGPANQVLPDQIVGLNAFTATAAGFEVGIREAHNGSGQLLDDGYDFGADAFFFADMIFTALKPGKIEIVTATSNVNGGLFNENWESIQASYSVVMVNVGQPILVGDVNQDGLVNLLDVGPFVELLVNMQFAPEADFNQDGVVDLMDVQPFVELLNT